MSDRANGRFGHQVVGGHVDYDAAAYYEPLLGIPASMQYIYGSLRSEAGSYYWPIRGLYADRTRHLHLSESKDGGEFVYAPEGEAAYDGPVEKQGGPNAGARSPDGKAFLFETDGNTLRYIEEGCIDLTAEVVGRTTQFHAPDAECPLIYTSTVIRTTEATVKGEEVSGILFYDALHLPEGVSWVTSPYYADLQAAWVAFITEFDDGNLAFGHLVHGVDGFNVLLTQRTDGDPMVSRSFATEVTLEGPDEFPHSVRYLANDSDQVWRWDALPVSRMPVRKDLVEGHRWRQGVVTPEGETRAVTRSEGLMETYNSRLIAPERI